LFYQYVIPTGFVWVRGLGRAPRKSDVQVARRKNDYGTKMMSFAGPVMQLICFYQYIIPTGFVWVRGFGCSPRKSDVHVARRKNDYGTMMMSFAAPVM
jgi:hypothetical protein